MSETTIDDDPSAEILAAILTDERLQRYYHRDTRPERFPLQIVDAAGAGLVVPDPDRTGVPAVLVASSGQAETGRAPLIVDRYTVEGAVAHVSFRFPLEGIAGEVSLSHAGDGWRIDEMRLVER